MSDELYKSMREYIRLAVQLEVRDARDNLREELTRSAPKIVEGPPGKDGKDGRDGVDGKNGVDGVNGKDGTPGERGANGIATREELESIVEARFADLQVRTFADIYKGVYTPDTAYTRGVLVTWGGSLWLSQADTRLRPGEAADWKLVVKKGSDGRK